VVRLTSPAHSGHSSAFEVSGFGWLWLNSLFTAATFTIETLSQGWLVLLLTNSPLWVGLVAGLRGASQAVCSLPSGSLADRMDRRTLLIATQAVGAGAASAIGLLVLAHRIQPWHLLAYVTVAGAVYSANRPCMNGLVFDVVGGQRLLNASALQSMAGSLFRIFGAVGGGVIIDKLGVGDNYLLVAGCYLAGSGALLLLRHHARAGPASASEPLFEAIAQGFRYAVRTPRIRHLLALSFINESFGFSFFTMLPVMARDVLKVGAIGMGALSAMFGLGQLTATVRITLRRDVGNKGKVVVAAALGFGIFVTLFGLSPWYLASLFLVAAIGYMGSTYDATMATVVQLATADEMRGRVLGLYAFTLSLSPLGGLITGALATILNASLAVAFSGGVVIAGAMGLFPKLQALDLAAPDTDVARAPDREPSRADVVRAEPSVSE
jgi:MFS family permease